VGSKEERERISNRIIENCGEELKVKVQERRNPRLVIHTIPEEVTMENATNVILQQTSDTQLDEGDLQDKCIYRTKRNLRNLVIEVIPHARKLIMNTRIKIEWVICKAADYIQISRCFKCSRYNHRFADCRGEETCPPCTGKHKLGECTSSQNDYKYINCMTYNKYNPRKTICINHSSLDKQCASLQAQLKKHEQNTN